MTLGRLWNYDMENKINDNTKRYEQILDEYLGGSVFIQNYSAEIFGQRYQFDLYDELEDRFIKILNVDNGQPDQWEDLMECKEVTFIVDAGVGHSERTGQGVPYLDSVPDAAFALAYRFGALLLINDSLWAFSNEADDHPHWKPLKKPGVRLLRDCLNWN